MESKWSSESFGIRKFQNKKAAKVWGQGLFSEWAACDAACAYQTARTGTEQIATPVEKSK